MLNNKLATPKIRQDWPTRASTAACRELINNELANRRAVHNLAAVPIFRQWFSLKAKPILGTVKSLLNYDERWRDLRTRIRLFRSVWFSGLIVLIVIIFSRLSLKLTDRGIFGVAIVWGITSVAAEIYQGTFKCPRCSKRYFWRSWYFLNLNTRKCLNCGLERWSIAVANSS